MQAVYAAAASLSMEAKRGRVVHDSPSQLPLSKLLAEGDLVLLLTPGVAPNPANISMDPFEPLGRAMAAHHPWIRHVPYLPRNGITDTHIVHINLAKLVVFVISGPPRHGQMSQVVLAEMSRSHCEHRPHIIVACCDIRELGPLETSFTTVIQLPSYSPIELETAANLLFQEPERSPTATTGPVVRNLITAPKSWFVDNWDENRDEAAVYGLWCQCFPAPFRLHRFLLRSLLRRDGYAMHYIVRDPGTLEVLGFCATYTTYVDSGGERLIGSMAALVVRPSYRQRGVGLSLHLHALRQLAKTRGVCRLQLGSTFPRIFTGLPSGSPSEDWFKRRGWRMDGRGGPGTGQEACDWLLKFDDWPAMNLVPNGLVFRQCDISEFGRVLGVVERESRRKDNVGFQTLEAPLRTIFRGPG
ncbi:hypothetical protein QBC46DRAFT_375433 [Diplogelasinospora grovesii]|uniref:N-acetyltransferase domain-containing protein n=1 Tax=Diplogelasinospora grovesii TaxID=303347 RepID=A0AAN6NG00_9PEZI|nr:hypothetical protein QBC46DRAFT_375433 [Diplogelasinospora grovesii]